MAVENMEEITLGCCGITVWYPRVFLKEKRDTRGDFYCPNGHSRAFTETTATRLQRELDATKKELERKEEKLTDLKTGKCPFCWKTVKDISSHIKTSHT